MRALGLVGLLLALLIVAWIAKEQLGTTTRLPEVPGAAQGSHAKTVRGQAKQIEDQYKNAVENAMKKEQKTLRDNTR